MRELVLTPKFRKAYRRAVRRDRALQGHIEDVLRRMQDDGFQPALGTHKLSGALEGLWACSCGYDCRVVFAIETEQGAGREVILLLDIGTHEEVY
jgi:mRNA-degrading endonuclease YafQ of YafQ-DinJ toxin-antitoxin module